MAPANKQTQRRLMLRLINCLKLHKTKTKGHNKLAIWRSRLWCAILCKNV